MAKLHEEAGADAPPPPWPDADPLQIKIEPGDALFGPGAKGSEKASRGSSFFGRLLLTAALCGLAWAAGVYSSSGHLPFDLLKWSPGYQAQQATARDEMASSLRQMAEDMRALKASVTDKQAAPVQTATGATITDLGARLDKLEADLTTKLSQMNDRLATIEQQIAASHVASASRAPAHAKHVEHHDAFNPALDATARRASTAGFALRTSAASRGCGWLNRINTPCWRQRCTATS